MLAVEPSSRSVNHFSGALLRSKFKTSKACRVSRQAFLVVLPKLRTLCESNKVDGWVRHGETITPHLEGFEVFFGTNVLWKGLNLGDLIFCPAGAFSYVDLPSASVEPDCLADVLFRGRSGWPRRS